MRFFPIGIFWGLILLLLGLNIILKAVFNISLPFFRIILGLFIVAMGISMIIGTPLFGKKPVFTGKYEFFFLTASCDLSDIDYSKFADKLEFNAFFSDSTIDLTKIDYAKMEGKTIEINTIFGNTKVIADKEASLEIQGTAAFGNTVLPKGDSVVFGQMARSFNSGAPKGLTIKANSVFGMTSLTQR